MKIGDTKWQLKNQIISLVSVKQEIVDEDNYDLATTATIDKSAEATTELYLKELLDYGINGNSLLTSTSDTTGSAINVFKEHADTRDVARIKCLSHRKQLFLKHSIAGEYVPTGKKRFQKHVDGGRNEDNYYCDALLQTLLAINEVCKKVGGNEYCRLLLENALKAAGKKVLMPRKHFEVRWNSFEEVVARYVNSYVFFDPSYYSTSPYLYQV